MRVLVITSMGEVLIVWLLMFDSKEEKDETMDGAAAAASDNEEEDEEDQPVQGPINKEPDEKLYPGMKSEESGIRKL